MELLKTGIAGFDEFLRGGLPARTYLLIGPPGSGNEVFARQVAFHRAEQGEVSYFIDSKTPESVREDMSCFNWDVKTKEKNGTWRFVKLKKKDSLIDVYTYEMEQKRCVVVDSLSELLLRYKIDEVIALLSAMTSQSRENKEISLILLSEGMQEPKDEITLQHFVDGVINFTTAWRGNDSTNNISVRKIAGSIVPTRSLAYSIGTRGFTIETATRIT